MSDGVIHLRDDHDSVGESQPWCDTMTFSCVERPETVTCRECLEAVIKFAAECAERLDVLKG